MKKRKSVWIFRAIIPVIFGIFIFGAAPAMAEAPEGTLVEAIHWPVSANWLDPSIGHAGTLGWFPLSLFHDALIKPMPGGPYTPCLAESYSANEDYSVYEFKLREGVKFHNGDTMTAEDVVFSFNRYKGRLNKFLHDMTEKVEAVNPYLVRFQFKQPFPDFPEYFLPGASTIGWIVPKKYVEEVGDAGFKKHPIGAGPYKFVEFVPGVKLVVEAFEGYWRKVPNIKRMEFMLIPNRATRMAMIKRGEADVATLITDILIDEVKRDPKLRLLAPVSPVRFPIYLTAQWDPKSPWSNLRVRQAASLAIDRQTLADIHAPGQKPSGSIGIEGGYDPWVVEFPPDPYDPAKAKKLMADAGYPNGFDGGIFYPNELYWGYAEQVATYWRAIGITVRMQRLERPAWYAYRDGGKMKGAVIMDIVSGSTITSRLAYLFGPSSYGNYPEIETLWAQFQKEYKPEVRKDLIERIQKIMHEELMMIPLTGINSPAAVGPRVKGDPYMNQPLIWFTAPFEDMELQ